MKTLVDANVLIDVLTEDAAWYSWSSDKLSEAADQGEVIINPIIYAEVSLCFDRIEDLDEALADFNWQPLNRPSAFLAARCFLRYRRSGGTKVQVLPDFLIGAHAAVEGWTLLTRDVGRFATYFPKLNIVHPS